MNSSCVFSKNSAIGAVAGGGGSYLLTILATVLKPPSFVVSSIGLAAETF